MNSIFEFLADRPTWIVPILIALEITVISALALIGGRFAKRDAATRYGLGLAALALIWVAIPVTLWLQSTNWATLKWSRTLVAVPSYEVPVEAAPVASTPSWWILLWILGSLAFLVRILVGGLKVWSLRRNARPMPNASSNVPVLVSRYVDGPVVVGALRPAILLPPSVVQSLGDEELADVLAHELAHIAKKHLIVAVFQRITGALLWPHPLVHLLNRQLVEAREEVCDNVALQTAGPVRYARVLLRVAECRRQVPQLATALGLFGQQTQLEKRVQSLLDPNRRITTDMNTKRFTFAFAALALAVAAIGAARIDTEIVVQDPALATTDSALNAPQFKAVADTKVVEGKPVNLKLKSGNGKKFEGQIIEVRVTGTKQKKSKRLKGQVIEVPIKLSGVKAEVSPKSWRGVVLPSELAPSTRKQEAQVVYEIATERSNALSRTKGQNLQISTPAQPATAPLRYNIEVLVPMERSKKALRRLRLGDRVEPAIAITPADPAKERLGQLVKEDRLVKAEAAATLGVRKASPATREYRVALPSTTASPAAIATEVENTKVYRVISDRGRLGVTTVDRLVPSKTISGYSVRLDDRLATQRALGVRTLAPIKRDNVLVNGRVLVKPAVASNGKPSTITIQGPVTVTRMPDGSVVITTQSGRVTKSVKATASKKASAPSKKG